MCSTWTPLCKGVLLPYYTVVVTSTSESSQFMLGHRVPRRFSHTVISDGRFSLVHRAVNQTARSGRRPCMTCRPGNWNPIHVATIRVTATLICPLWTAASRIPMLATIQLGTKVESAGNPDTLNTCVLKGWLAIIGPVGRREWTRHMNGFSGRQYKIRIIRV